MNITAIQNLASLLENLPAQHERGFNMETYIDENLIDEETNVGFKCNSTACIAGWACLALDYDGTFRKTIRTKEPNGLYEGVAAEILDLDEDTALSLFEPMNTDFDDRTDVRWDTITPQQAAKVLRHLAKTGEVDWSIVLTS
ncbi:MAG: hypothetical protein K5863_09165 [Nitratireductor sp.]|uniref:hypothetical protein n=1 Tax=Nitratireductor sp. TaxID=1872084 RepID=UPI0026390F9C|nr:hypothetical protein [Nitratireductor sp.]MCV0350234.1 hypothetical protein [Nitratireductor sp.]